MRLDWTGQEAIDFSLSLLYHLLFLVFQRLCLLLFVLKVKPPLVELSLQPMINDLDQIALKYNLLHLGQVAGGRDE